MIPDVPPADERDAEEADEADADASVSGSEASPRQSPLTMEQVREHARKQRRGCKVDMLELGWRPIITSCLANCAGPGGSRHRADGNG